MEDIHDCDPSSLLLVWCVTCGVYLCHGWLLWWCTDVSTPVFALHTFTTTPCATTPHTGALGGRLDHTIANLASLIRYPQLRVVLMGDGNLAQVVPPGSSTIVPVPGVEGPTCGLVPLFGDVVCSTKGLRWNLADTPMSMTGLISTSNLIEEEHVHVESNAPLLWTVEWSC